MPRSMDAPSARLVRRLSFSLRISGSPTIPCTRMACSRSSKRCGKKGSPRRTSSGWPKLTPRRRWACRKVTDAFGQAVATGLPPLPAFARYDAFHGPQLKEGPPRHSVDQALDGWRSATAGLRLAPMRIGGFHRGGVEILESLGKAPVFVAGR